MSEVPLYSPAKTPLAREHVRPAYRGTSLIRKRNPVWPYSRPMPRVLRGWAFSYERGSTCVLHMSASRKWRGGHLRPPASRRPLCIGYSRCVCACSPLKGYHIMFRARRRDRPGEALEVVASERFTIHPAQPCVSECFTDRIPSEDKGPYALTPNTVELIPTLGALFPRGGPVQDPVLTVSGFRKSLAPAEWTSSSRDRRCSGRLPCS